MNWLELGRIDLFCWFLFVVYDGRELPEMTWDLDEFFADLTPATDWPRELAGKRM